MIDAVANTTFAIFAVRIGSSTLDWPRVYLGMTVNAAVISDQIAEAS
jgi:hypothetical protein